MLNLFVELALKISRSNMQNYTGGCRDKFGLFYDQSYKGYWWWSSTELEPTAYHRYLSYNVANIDRYTDDKRDGFSVRIMRDRN